MGSSLLFPESPDLEPSSQALLANAYEKACDELAGEHQFNSQQLGALVDDMAQALLDLYSVGQHDEERLARYAVSRALSRLLQRNAR